MRSRPSARAHLDDVFGQVDADGADSALAQRGDEHAVVGAELDDAGRREGVRRSTGVAVEMADQAGDGAGRERVVREQDARVDRVDDLDQATVLAHADQQRIALLLGDRASRPGSRRRAAAPEVEERRAALGRSRDRRRPRLTSSRSAGARRAAGSAGTGERAGESRRRRSGAARPSARSARWGTRRAGSPARRGAQSNSSTITAKPRSRSGQQRNRSVRMARKPLVRSLSRRRNSAAPTTLPARETQRRDARHPVHRARPGEARGLDVRVALGRQGTDLQQVLGRVREVASP